jgi:hypothetical protein
VKSIFDWLITFSKRIGELPGTVLAGLELRGAFVGAVCELAVIPHPTANRSPRIDGLAQARMKLLRGLSINTIIK